MSMQSLTGLAQLTDAQVRVRASHEGELVAVYDVSVGHPHALPVRVADGSPALVAQRRRGGRHLVAEARARAVVVAVVVRGRWMFSAASRWFLGICLRVSIGFYRRDLLSDARRCRTSASAGRPAAVDDR